MKNTNGFGELLAIITYVFVKLYLIINYNSEEFGGSYLMVLMIANMNLTR